MSAHIFCFACYLQAGGYDFRKLVQAPLTNAPS